MPEANDPSDSPRVIERRFHPATELRVAKNDAGAPIIEGYAALFDSLSGDLGGFREQILPGAFSDALTDSPDVRCLFNHEPSQILGRTKAGTLRLREVEKGLWMEADLPDTQAGRDVAISMERGDVDQMSFAFDVTEGGAAWKPEGDIYVRTIQKVHRLYDVSPVTFAAYLDTSVALRSLEEFRATVKTEPPAESVPPPPLASATELRRRIARADERYGDYVKEMISGAKP